LGDDYLTKPFGIEELMACVRALLRRAETQGGPRPAPSALMKHAQHVASTNLGTSSAAASADDADPDRVPAHP